MLKTNSRVLYPKPKIYAAAENVCPRSLLWQHKRHSSVLSAFFLLFLRTKAARSAVPELPKPATKGIPSVLEGIPFELKRVPFGMKGVPSGLKGIPYRAEGVPSMLKGTPSGLKKVPLELKGTPFEASLCRVSSGNSNVRQSRTPYTPRVCSTQV
jgi:hypothetical protein